jgi:hypothetical protein
MTLWLTWLNLTSECGGGKLSTHTDRLRSCGGIGRRTGLKIRRIKPRAGSSPATSTIICIPYRGVEQLVACRAHNPKVGGSNPPSATNLERSY